MEVLLTGSMFDIYCFLNNVGWKIPDSAIRIGLEATEIPGRFQVVGWENSEALGCLSARLILDGGNECTLCKLTHLAFDINLKSYAVDLYPQIPTSCGQN